MILPLLNKDTYLFSHLLGNTSCLFCSLRGNTYKRIIRLEVPKCLDVTFMPHNCFPWKDRLVICMVQLILKFSYFKPLPSQPACSLKNIFFSYDPINIQKLFVETSRLIYPSTLALILFYVPALSRQVNVCKCDSVLSCQWSVYALKNNA